MAEPTCDKGVFVIVLRNSEKAFHEFDMRARTQKNGVGVF